MPSAYCAQRTRDLLVIAKLLFTVLFATYSVNVNFRDYSNYVDRMNPLFPCDHGAATHSCIMLKLGRGTVCNKKLMLSQRRRAMLCVSI